MKKNIAMRVAAFLFILTMISTCAFATTFAKYTTTGSATDSARVAKWGVTVDASSDAKSKGLFVGEYGVTVKASQDVVAPGTNGELACFAIDGQPEVSCEVTFEAAFQLYVEGESSQWKDDNDQYYCPIVITINGKEIKGLDCADAADFSNKVVTEIAKVKYTFTPGQDLGELNNQLTIEWSWAFDGNDDAKDTALGNAAANGVAPKISLKVTCTVTQLD